LDLRNNNPKEVGQVGVCARKSIKGMEENAELREDEF